MGLMDRFGRKSAIPRNATFRLTQEGKEKIQTYTGTPQARILVALETQGSSSDVDELAGTGGLSNGQVEKNVLALIQKGYVQRVGAGMSSGDAEE
jgi:DNA-binding MarR family transcriptional regulator